MEKLNIFECNSLKGKKTKEIPFFWRNALYFWLFLANKNLPDKRRDVSCIAMLVVGIPYLYLWARFAIQHIKCSGKPIKTHESSLHTPKELSVSVNATSKIVCCRKHCFETHDIPHSWGWRTSCFNGTQSG